MPVEAYGSEPYACTNSATSACERLTRFERATSSVAGKCSKTKLSYNRMN